MQSGKSAERAQPLVFISSGLPPIPSRLMARVQAGQFVDMAELAPERLCAWDPLKKKPLQPSLRMSLTLSSGYSASARTLP